MTDELGSQDYATLRILLVDDQHAVRQGLHLFFESEPFAHVVGEAASASEGLALAAKYQPHVVIMDLEMPGMDGIEATKRILASQPGCIVIMLTSHDNATARYRSREAGAWTLVSKARPDALQDAFRRARVFIASSTTSAQLD